MQNRRWGLNELESIRAVNQWRQPRSFDSSGPLGIFEGKEVVSFASNDYLGLANHPKIKHAACEAVHQWGTGATASRLVVGSRPCHDELETALAAWKETEAALVFGSGYAANLGLLSTLGGPDCLIISDELNHASIIDGCRLARSEVQIVRHNDVDNLEAVLSSAHQDRRVVVTEAVFSMDGDAAPLEAIGEVCVRYDALLVVDEAHAVLGPSSAALAAIEGLELVRIVTLSKALGTAGGAVCGARWIVDLLVNCARSFIFSTAPTPADTAAAVAAIGLVQSAEGKLLIERLTSLVRRVVPGHLSPIIPIMIGSEMAAVSASERLLERGLLIPAIRPPTVAPGTSRLRVALSAAHTDAMIDKLIDAVAELGLST